VKNQLIICPECCQPKGNIKRYKLFDNLLFLVFGAQAESSIYTCCSECMRKKIIKKTFNHNILAGWALWLVLIIPWHLIAYSLTYLWGHSKSVRKDIGI
jgi:hypothetical protein